MALVPKEVRNILSFITPILLRIFLSHKLISKCVKVGSSQDCQISLLILPGQLMDYGKIVLTRVHLPPLLILSLSLVTIRVCQRRNIIFLKDLATEQGQIVS